MPVEYIELQKGEYIDTEFIPAKNTGFYCKYLHLSADKAAGIFIMGMTQTNPSPPTGCVVVPTMGIYNTSYGWESINTIPNFSKASDIPAEGWLNFKNDNIAKLKCSDEEWSTELEELTSTITKPMYIGMLNRAGNASYYFHGRIYEVKITRDNLIIKHFVPVLDYLGNPCLLEKSENKLYHPQTMIQTLEFDDI